MDEGGEGVILAEIHLKKGKTMSERVASYPKYHQIKDAKMLKECTDTQEILGRTVMEGL